MCHERPYKKPRIPKLAFILEKENKYNETPKIEEAGNPFKT